MFEIDTLSFISGLTIGGTISLFFAIRKFYKWLLPIRLDIGYQINFGHDADKITAVITNKSLENQYITSCQARGTYYFKDKVMRHIRHPFAKPRFYKTMHYDTIVFSLMNDEPIKIEPMQQIMLCHHKSNSHPLSLLLAPFFMVELTLSSGRKVKSKKLPTPEKWIQEALSNFVSKESI